MKIKQQFCFENVYLLFLRPYSFQFPRGPVKNRAQNRKTYLSFYQFA